MEMEVPHRVHIMPQGYETDRIYKAAKKLKADKVVLLTHPESTEQGNRCQEVVQEKLEAENIEYDVTDCDFFNLYACLGKMLEVIRDYDGDIVSVNLSTGSKVTAVAGMMACMTTDATPYYVRADDYGEATVSSGVKSIDELRAYPMDRPERDHIRILEYIDEEGEVQLSDLIDFAEKNDLDFMMKRDVSDQKAKYGVLNEEIIEPLEEKGDITINRQGQSKLVQLTEVGENTLQAFKHLA
ncbi:DUF6293 family protein (plasmid) [Haladaptatus sp. SPP-AMP-3]|uniref:HFX_2341 family transcriptional regulator domain-containing protein n=1 Tax=Haladaptatus sp. SPP-AMP-3 TaxID=3121295 RepID=UPI003C2CF45D